MRKTQWFVASAMVAMGLVSTAGQGQSGDARAAAVMAQARAALGGEQKLASLKSLSIRGSYRRDASVPAGTGGNTMMMVVSGAGPGGATPQLTGDLEIDVEFPDKYIKVDAGTGMMAITRTDGFEGERPFSDVASSQPGMRIVNSRPGDDPNAAPMALRRSREELARLLLGLTAGTQPAFAVTYSYAGLAESPDGKADVIDVKGADNFAARLFLDAESHRPLMLTYAAAEPRVVMRMARGDGPPKEVVSHGGPPPQTRTAEGLTPEEKARLDQIVKETQSAPAKLVEYRLFFTDFREVNGLRLPHHITTGTAATTTEEWDIKTYKVNPSIKADRFKVGS
jgi:hypothetical protein